MTGNFTANSTVVLGSGTKPYVAAAVMRLVDSGLVGFEDKAATHIDPCMSRLWNTTFVGLMGPPAANVTVAHLLRHQSGLADFDVQTYERRVLLNETGVHDPLEDLQWVANLTGPLGCKNHTCTWLFKPGTGDHIAYSSTNFLLAGVVVLCHQPHLLGWRSLDLASLLDLPKLGLHHTFFPTAGHLPEEGLTTVGSSHLYGDTDLFDQDSSIMGWCYGNAVASARDGSIMAVVERMFVLRVRVSSGDADVFVSKSFSR